MNNKYAAAKKKFAPLTNDYGTVSVIPSCILVTRYGFISSSQPWHVFHPSPNTEEAIIVRLLGSNVPVRVFSHIRPVHQINVFF